MIPLADGPAGPASVPGVVLASWGRRAGALLIDSLIFAVLLTIGITFVALGAIRDDQTSGADGLATILAVVGLVLCLAALGFHLWQLGWRQGACGQSFGKQVVGIRLVRVADGRPLGGGTGLGRLLLRALLGGVTSGIYTILTYLWPLWDDHRQTLDDKIFSTVVIRS
ncbi:RDD family protein [Tenggerimyces flavus]|uniref:RDD family protein n=1 Tax=Tenggerimyces flavus TaxID=1708749 RepID=A0ABV7YNM7_9ACTN|nr:RDD family protein [Tenggerimyces flavus]MBM7790143.1 putative RDD family membrane protein YckC [Tenggerimyces flavus]